MMTGESRNTAFILASDATLVGAAKQENSVAFDVLAKRHLAKVRRGNQKEDGSQAGCQLFVK